jgi:hypothetical protein
MSNLQCGVAVVSTNPTDPGSFAPTKENLKAIKSALASGVDHVDLVRQREERET